MYFLSHISIHAFFLTFPFKFYLYKKFKLSIKDYLLLIYTFMCMIIFLRIIIISFQSHQIRIHSAGLGMAWNQEWLSCTAARISIVIFVFILWRVQWLFGSPPTLQKFGVSEWTLYRVVTYHRLYCARHQKKILINYSVLLYYYWANTKDYCAKTSNLMSNRSLPSNSKLMVWAMQYR